MNEQSTAVQVKILDKEYQVNCPPSDQEALMKSAKYLDENMRKIKGRGNIHGGEKIAVMAALNITHDMLRKNRMINESRHITAQQVKGIEDKIDLAIATSRQLEIWNHLTTSLWQVRQAARPPVGLIPTLSSLFSSL